MSKNTRSRSRSREKLSVKSRISYKELDKKTSRRELNPSMHAFNTANLDPSRMENGYSNDNNPFGDPYLNEKFEWGAGNKVQDPQEVAKQLQALKNLRDNRTREKYLKETKPTQLANTDDKSWEEWAKKEEQFYKDQQYLRSEIRIKQRRESPIDNFVKMLLVLKKKLPLEPGFEKYMINPISMLDFFSLRDLEDSINIIQSLKQSNYIPDAVTYWESVEILMKDRFSVEQTKFNITEGRVVPKLPITNDYKDEINLMIDNKKLKELQELERSVGETIKDPSFAIDVEYWEYMLNRIKIKKAEQIIKEMYQQLKDKSKTVEIEKEMQTIASLEFADKSMSPRKEQISDVAKIPGTLMTLEEFWIDVDKKRVNIFNMLLRKNKDELKKNLLKKISLDFVKYEGSKSYNIDEEDNYLQQIQELEKTGGKSEMEMTLSKQVNLHQKYEWSDKYEPRKPHYFNRVKLGYEWTKYNQSHYDIEHLPPRVIIGYRFNIFYPNLIDKTKTPNYTLHASDDPKFCVIKFHAEPPYEDVAFKIVCKMWDFNEKHGFKCVFDRGILHLYFNFQRNRYRR